MTNAEVVLIGGPPGAGKSTLGRTLAANLQWSSLTADDLLVAARTLTTPGSHPGFHHATRVGHVRYFTEGPPDKLIADSLERETAMWEVLKRVISSRLSSRSPVVIDWWLLRPEAVATIDDERVRSIWLHIDPEALWAWERTNTDWMEGSSDPERMLANFMERSIWRNELVATEAKELGMPVLHVNGAEAPSTIAEKALALLEIA